MEWFYTAFTNLKNVVLKYKFRNITVQNEAFEFVKQRFSTDERNVTTYLEAYGEIQKIYKVSSCQKFGKLELLLTNICQSILAFKDNPEFKPIPEIQDCVLLNSKRKS